MSDKTKPEKPKKPVQKIRGGGIEISIWKNEGANGPWYSITLRRNYKQGDAWKESDSYAEDDLLRLAKLADEADTWIVSQRQQQQRAESSMSHGHRPRTPRGDSHRRPTPQEISAHHESVVAEAKEVLEHIYKAVLAVPAFTLKDGGKAHISALGSPEIDEAGELTCSFDVDLADGAHLEFTVKNTGWGRSFAQDLARNPSEHGRSR